MKQLFIKQKKISLNLEQKNCNKIRITDLNMLKKQDILDLPDVLIMKESTNLNKEEQKLLIELNIKIIIINDEIINNEALFKQKINEIERTIYESRTQKYRKIEQKK